MSSMFFIAADKLQHSKTNAKKATLVMCHPSGFSSDIHRILDVNNYNSKQSSINFNNVRYEKGGNQLNAELSSADDYLKNNFSEQKVICFPPDVSLDQSLQQVHDELKAYYEKKKRRSSKFIILTNYSSEKHFQYTESSPSNFDINLHQNDEERILVFDGELNSIINLRILNSTNPKDLKEMYNYSHQDLKAILHLHFDLIQSTKVRLVSVVVTTSMKREFLKTKIHCQECLDLTITKDELVDGKSFKKRWDKVKDNLFLS